MTKLSMRRIQTTSQPRSRPWTEEELNPTRGCSRVIGARDRRAASHTERARLDVTRAIRAAMANLARDNPLLGRRLAATNARGAVRVPKEGAVLPLDGSLAEGSYDRWSGADAS
jgi:hypothetical protein